MSVAFDYRTAGHDLESGYRARREYAESQWRKYSALAQQWHDEFMEAERAVVRIEMTRRPSMAPPVSLEIVGE